ncbi:MAG: virulence protein [Bacteroidales bacterium]|nr:virulence protein [Bacteroidales bacterium]
MEIKFNVTGADRKQLVGIISEVTGWKAVYKGMPSAAYVVNNTTITKDGTCCFDERTDYDIIREVLEAADKIGFKAESISDELFAQSTTEEPTELITEAPSFTISIPLDKVATGNLANLLDARASLIKKALGITDLGFIIEKDKITFPWFSKITEPDEATAYTQFIAALCQMSINQKRINSTEKSTDNEKYTFRCFLLRLGFIGDEYKQSRKILLRNLSGSSAFKSGAAKEVANDEISE